MEIQIRHNPSFSVARILLGPGEPIRAESGAMMAMAVDTSLDARIEGGLMKGLKRSVLGGESLFITTATAGPQGGWIDLAPSLPGDVAVATITPDAPLLVQRGSFLAAEQGVEIDTKWGGMRNLIGGEGGFLLRASGQGEIVLSTYGALDRFQLAAGQQVVVDTNHMVAFSESVTMELRKASESAWKSMKSGEGLVFVFTGPGELMMQSRNPDEIVRYIAANMPGNRA
ncbi:MAG: TIGR00266 family protein [Actinomyces sp.]|nr:MAG: TIGR00266 family protein [Actinomyces sp.]